MSNNDKDNNENTVDHPTLYGPDGKEISSSSKSTNPKEQGQNPKQLVRRRRMTVAECWQTALGVILFLATSILAWFAYWQWESTDRAARAAEISAYSAWLAVFTSEMNRMSGEFSVKKTLGEMEAQSEAMKRAANASVKNADAAIRSSVTAEKSFRFAQRAYIDATFLGGLNNFERGTTPSISYALSNTGHMPATFIMMMQGFEVGNVLPEKPNYQGFRPYNGYQLHPGKGFGHHMTLDTFTHKQYDLVSGGHAKLWYFFSLSYTDAFGFHRSCAVVFYNLEKKRMDVETEAPKYNCGD